jgi:SAM-dependent methyltransferase
LSSYQGTEGTRPYAGAGWYYAAYRERVSGEFMAMLAERLGWTRDHRVLDLGAGPGQLSFLVAPLVGEVVAVEPEPDMVAEGERRARAGGIDNVTFVAASSADLARLRQSLGSFRAVLMGQSFHWMVDKDRVLLDLSAIVQPAEGAVAFVSPLRVATPDALQRAQDIVNEILKRHLEGVPPGPHPQGRHDPFEQILARSPFPRLERIERVYDAPVSLTVESLLGFTYSLSHVLARLGDRRAAFERDVRAKLGDLDLMDQVVVTRRDEALIGRRAK